MTNLTDQSLNVTRTQNHFYQMRAAGLRPTTKHAITIDGVDYAFATRQFGKAFGDDLISNDNGEIVFGILYEIPFARDQNFELPQRQTLQFEADRVQTQNTRRNLNVVNNFKIIELISADGQSYTQLQLRLPLLIQGGPVAAVFPIE